MLLAPSCDKYRIDPCVGYIVSDIGLRINLSIKNLLPDLYIVRISYLSLALNETGH